MKLLPYMRIPIEASLKAEELLEKEWIVTNCLGGYASSTVLGINTRKYHGLLVAAFRPPRKRMVCLTKLNEELKLENALYPFYTNEFQNGMHPSEFWFPTEFYLSPFPKYVYNIHAVKIFKTVFMLHRRNVTIVLYDVHNGNPSDVEIRVFPLLTCRHFHSVTDRRRNPLKFIQSSLVEKLIINVEAPPSTIVIAAVNGAYQPLENWFERVYFREECARGESCFEDWFQPGFFKFKVSGKSCRKFAITAAARGEETPVDEEWNVLPEAICDVEKLYAGEIVRRQNMLEKFYKEHETVYAQNWLSWIILATEAFIVEAVDKSGKSEKTVIAGYHWFEDWGRDVFISLPGLMLVTGRFEDAEQTFLTFNKYCANGLIPNLISDWDAKPAYNAVDASLWYMNAVLQYLKYTGNFAFVLKNLWQNLKTLAENLANGVYADIRVDSDGLLFHKPRLTWMDVAINGQPVTPRGGKAVEIQALWYNGLKTLQFLAEKNKETSEAEKFACLAEKAKESFVKKFWNPLENCLFDVLDLQDYGDASIRPNQVMAVSLDFTMMDRAKNSRILNVVFQKLLTPYGLRTLAKTDPRYKGIYHGDRRSRDSAYHNGTVWPWLIGPFTTAYLKIEGYSEYTRRFIFENFLSPLLSEQVFNAGLGMVSEIFDGDPPHSPRGCIAQAWSIAEPLRAYVEDVMLIRPKYEKEILHALT
ncbi:MAG: amylo-alpha-1,6-glucosidase [Candidatus Bathyarchaeia archaeon]